MKRTGHLEKEGGNGKKREMAVCVGARVEPCGEANIPSSFHTFSPEMGLKACARR